ncbi:hypothetical protein OXX80_006143 [Metschnikowia pulcherrima]
MGFLKALTRHFKAQDIPETDRLVRSDIRYYSDGSDSDTKIPGKNRSKDNKDQKSGIVTIINERNVDEPFIDLTVYVSPEESQRREISLAYKVKRFLWDGTGKHHKEQRYLMKLDTCLLSSAMLGYFIKSLNQSNINTAYINGMSEYYDMQNNQYNYLVTLWTVGYIVGQIPSNLILHKISARYYLGGLELMWSALTLLSVTCRRLPALYAVRFFLGLSESGYFPGMEYLLGSNYSEAEISSRGAFFAVAGNMASLISGPLQLALLRRFENSSIEPFKWLFVVDALISFPVGLYTILVGPNTPSTTDAFYFTEEDKLVGLERRRLIGAQIHTGQDYTLCKIRSFFDTWHIYVFPLLFMAYNNACSAWGQPAFNIWMKKVLRLAPEKYNVYPSIYTALSIVITLSLAYSHNYIGGRKNHYYIMSFFVPVALGCVFLAKYEIPNWLHWLSFGLVGIPTSYGQPFIFSWVNRLLYDDDMKRNFVIVTTNTLAYVTRAWVPIFVWNTHDQPRYFVGFVYTACLCGFGLCMTFVAWWLSERDDARRRRLSNAFSI